MEDTASREKVLSDTLTQQDSDNWRFSNPLPKPTPSLIGGRTKRTLVMGAPYIAIGAFCYFKKYNLGKSAIVTAIGGTAIWYVLAKLGSD